MSQFYGEPGVKRLSPGSLSTPELKRAREREYQRRYCTRHLEKVRAIRKRHNPARAEWVRMKMRTDPEFRAKRVAYGRAAVARRTPAQKKALKESQLKYFASPHSKFRTSKYNFRTKIRALLAVSTDLSCTYCAETDVRVLAVNHKNGGGGADEFKGGNLYAALAHGKRGTDDLEIVCHNCNIRYEYFAERRAVPTNWQEIIAIESAAREKTVAA